MPVKVIALRLLIKRWLRKRSTKATEQGRARFVICTTGSEGNIDPDENPHATDDANTPSHDGLAAPDEHASDDIAKRNHRSPGHHVDGGSLADIFVARSAIRWLRLKG